MNYVVPLLICAVAAAVEGACAGRDPLRQLRALNQPAWSPPAWLWVAIGLAWYGICFTAWVRLLPFWGEAKLPLILLAALMLANGGVNLFQFRLRRLDLAFFSLFPYWLLLAAFIASAWPLDRLSGLLFGGYALYQLYAAAWQWRLWRMNPRPR